MIKIIKWIVIKWKQIWRTIWFNTANIKYSKKDISDWVYKINIIIDSKLYHWAWCYRKYIETFESHIFDFESDIYWKKIEIIILKKIRKNKKTESFNELKELIENDIKIIKNLKFNVLTFWTFDLVHEWHNYFLNEAKKYSDKLITIVATDKNIEKFKWKKPLYNQKERIFQLKNLKISDEVIGWDEKNPLKWIGIYNPNIICLWYDQIWYSENLEKYINENNLKINIIRLKPFKKNIFKSSIIKSKKDL